MLDNRDMSILIVEDNMTCIFLYEALFSPYSANITYIKSGEEAIMSFKDNEYNLVVMDVILPGVNGIETAYQMRKIDRNVPILFVTASALSFVNNDFFEFENFGIIDKPISSSYFFRSLENLLSQSCLV